MKIFIKNFGPIANFEFDLAKDLNIIFGKNNIGKSYAITAVYLILKNLIDESGGLNVFEFGILFSQFNEKDSGKNPELSDFHSALNNLKKLITDNLKSNEAEELDITEETEKIFSTAISQILLQRLENSLKNSFSSLDELSNKYSNRPLSIELAYNDFNIIIGVSNNSLVVNSLQFKKRIFAKIAHTNRKPLITDERFTIYYNKKSNEIDLIQDCISRLYVFFKGEVSSVIDDVYFLPASRSGLYQALSTFSAVIAELSKSRNFLTNRIELPNISEPVSDYFLNLSNINTRPKARFADIVDILENDILNGKIVFNEESKKIVFTQNEINNELDLSFTSSMISEIAPIVAYLKYVIGSEKQTNFLMPIRLRIGKEKGKGHNLIFIEEPEAHLHPEIQVRLMEIFALLINKRIKIIMTTHSNYMFNKLSNLILDNQIDHNRVGSYLMKRTTDGSVMDPISMKAEEEGIIDENFADTAEKLYEERIAIYDRLNSAN